MSHFLYSRKDFILTKNAEGQPIPILDEEGKPLPNQFEKTEILRQDTMNLNKVIRSYRKSDEELIVLLDDGHETTEKVPELINPKKGPVMGNIREVKNTMWVQSEILLLGQDIENFYNAIRV